MGRGELDPMTARNHRSALNHFARTVAKPAAKVTARDVERWLETRSHLRPTTRRSQFSYLTTFCRWLVLEGHLSTDPTAGLKPPRVPRSVPRALPAAYIARLVERCPDARGRAIVWLMVGMGLRCCEVSNLELDDWDRHAELMRVRGKGAHERELPVPPEVAEALEDYLAEKPAAVGPLVRFFTVASEGMAIEERGEVPDPKFMARYGEAREGVTPWLT